MILSVFTLLSALSISATAAYFSIVGLATMFPGAQSAIIIMGSVLEVGKIIAAIWLHLKWKNLSFLIKSYLSFAVLTLMLITSMGIFGFLSKSYIVHEAEANKEIAQIEQIEKQIHREKELITKYEKTIIDAKESKSEASKTKINFIEIEESRIEKINSICNESILTETSGIERWNSRLKELDKILAEIKSKSGIFSSSKKKAQEEELKQQTERKGLSEKIALSEKNITTLQSNRQKNITEIQEKIKTFQDSVLQTPKASTQNTEIDLLISKGYSSIEELNLKKFDLNKRVTALEVEVGPIKYIVELFNDLGKSGMGIDSAVRLVIIALIFVFDPLAVLLVVIAVSSFSKKKEETIKVVQVKHNSINRNDQPPPATSRRGLKSNINWSQDNT
jgi:hypothetical protein